MSSGSLECERVDSSEAQIRERCVTSAVDTSVPGQVQQLSHTLLLLNQRVGDGGGKKLGQFGGISRTRGVVERWRSPPTVA